MLDVLFKLQNWKKYTQPIITFIEIFLLIDINQYIFLEAVMKR